MHLSFLCSGRMPHRKSHKEKERAGMAKPAAPYFDRVPRFLVRHGVDFFRPGRFSDFGRSCHCVPVRTPTASSWRRWSHRTCACCAGVAIRSHLRFTVAAPRGNDAKRRRRPAFHPDSPVEQVEPAPACIPVRFACGESIPCPAGNYKKKEAERRPAFPRWGGLWPPAKPSPRTGKVARRGG